MANQMRWRYGDTKPIQLAVDSGTVIEIGDLVFLDADDGKPAADLAYGASLDATQESLHDVFAGVAMQASSAGDTSDIRIATNGIFEFDQAQASVQVGDRVGVDDNAAGDTLLNQQVIGVPSSAPERSIGTCAKAATNATKILIAINSTVMNDGPQAIATS